MQSRTLSAASVFLMITLFTVSAVSMGKPCSVHSKQGGWLEEERPQTPQQTYTAPQRTGVTEPNNSTVWTHGQDSIVVDWEGLPNALYKASLYLDGESVALLFNWCEEDPPIVVSNQVMRSWGSGEGFSLVLSDDAGNEYTSEEFRINANVDVVFPDRYACWSTGSTNTGVAWCGHQGYAVKLSIMKNGEVIDDYSGWTANTGTYERYEPIPLSWGTGPGYQIRVEDIFGNVAESAEFEIGSIPVVMDEDQISWDGGFEAVKIELFNGDSLVVDLTGWIDNSGSFNVSDLHLQGEYFVEEGDSYRIRVSDWRNSFGFLGSFAWATTVLERIADAKDEDRLIGTFLNFYFSYELDGADSTYIRNSIHELAMYYADSLPQGETVPWFLFTDAVFHYNAGEYATAREAYQRVFYEYPTSDYAARSAWHLAMTFEDEDMHSEAVMWYERAEEIAAQRGENLDDAFNDLGAAISWRAADAVAQTDNTDSLLVAAALFEQSAKEYSGTDHSPVFLFDAGQAYGSAGDIENAVRVLQLLADNYPDSELASSALPRAGFLALEAERFNLAGDLYFQAYNRFPDDKDAGTTLLSAALAYEQGQSDSMAYGIYELIISSPSTSPRNLVYALGRYGDYLYDAGDFQGAREIYQQCVDVFDLNQEGPAAHAARSAFRIAEIFRQDYDMITLTAQTVEQKAQIKIEVESWYGKSITYNVDVWFMASCVRAGELYEDFANSVAFMDPPDSITDPESVNAFYDQLYAEFYEPQIQRAEDIYVTAIEKAASAGVSNEWVDKAAENLELLRGQ